MTSKFEQKAQDLITGFGLSAEHKIIATKNIAAALKAASEESLVKFEKYAETLNDIFSSTHDIFIINRIKRFWEEM